MKYPLRKDKKMPNLLLIRLHPVEPVSADVFTTYLNGLSIAAHELSYNHPDGSIAALGTAAYIAPFLPQSPSLDPTPVPDPSNRITQHFEVVPDPLLPQPGWQVRNFFAVATAVIVIPDPPVGGEYRTADVRLTITRGGKDIVYKQMYYNVPVHHCAADPCPELNDPNSFQDLEPTGLHLALPSPDQQLNPSFTSPEDGTAPNFTDLRTSVENVLNSEPGSTANIADLPYDKCRHIAYEIIWDRKAFPLPVPHRKLEELYTGPHYAGSDEERDRQMFEGELLSYYVNHNGEAERLAQFVFSLSAAIWCEEKSKKAANVGYYFPVLLNSSFKETKVILKGSGPVLDPVFVVPAPYFYALTAILPPQVKREQRFKMTALLAEAQIVSDIEQALDDHVLTEPAGVNRYQAGRRLRALGASDDKGTPECEIAPASPAHGLLSDWLAFSGQEINGFWSALSPTNKKAHLDLVLCAITQAYNPLVVAIKDPSFGVTNVDQLNNQTSGDWEDLLKTNPVLLPDFTKPGTTEERIQAFIRHLRKFFDIQNVYASPASPTMEVAPVLGQPPGQPADWLNCIQGVLDLTDGIQPDGMRFSVMEALWARGITDKKNIQGLAIEDLREALIGSVAYDWVQIIWNNSGAVQPGPIPGPSGFKPVNPDGSLTNCIPPAHLSPLGPIAYLHELLQVSADSNCEDPTPKNAHNKLSALLVSRRGTLGDLLATKSNLDVPLPLIDLVNESLEYMAANNAASGKVYNTTTEKVGGHELTTALSPTGKFQHDPEILFETLPEHSTPAVLTDAQAAYTKLKNDFSSCLLPYSQPLDVARTYLRQLGTSRFAVMRRFRKAITEFVLDPTHEPVKFQSHLWRYPVRIETAIEYLDISPEAYKALYQNNVAITASGGGNREEVVLYTLYGFASEKDPTAGGKPWIDVVAKVSEFLKRTCLTYCEFLELWKSGFVKFGLKGNREKGFPDCEPCCLDEYVIEFEDPADAAEALKRLAIFIRLWRTLQVVPNARYTFTQLRDICQVLELFIGANINPDFIRQLVAFQMFRDDFHLSLTDGTAPVTGTTGAERLHLLAFWAPGASKSNWAVEHLLYQIQQHAIHNYDCGCREPEFIRLIKANLDPLSELAGFRPDPSNPADGWHGHPTHTLRFAEILTKIYASEFGVGELLFLFTNAEHLQGDDPFPLQTANEAKDSPLGLPDDEDRNSLWMLRKKLLSVKVSTETALQWTWARMEATLRDDFGYAPQPGNDRWLSLGQHFFPSILANSGIAVSPSQRQYKASLSSPTSDPMWNTPLDGPFHYDAAARELWTEIPLPDEAVLAKLSRIRQLSADEQNAVRDLYFLPRVDLAHFAFIFNNFGEAEERLIQEPDEAKRWDWFQKEFARFYRRCQVIAEHLAAHVADATVSSNIEGAELAKLLLKHLWADENGATSPWERNDGQPPGVTWKSQPNGGAFAALLGLTGTGMLAEYFDTTQTLRWREVRGGMDAFGPEENAWNSPIPTILPSMSLTFSPEQLRFAAVRNGFAMANTDGLILGGAEPFTLHWKGLLLIEHDGQYGFSAGAPTPEGVVPDFAKAAQSHSWRVILKRGQKTWVLLSHDWPNEEAPSDCSKPIALKKGFYEMDIELKRNPLVFDGPEDVCPEMTGFQLKYKGPDAGMEWLTVPHDKLFQEQKNDTLQSGIDVSGVAQQFLKEHFTSTMRDIRRTYQRAYKAMLLVSRLRLSARRIADDGQSELGYMLSHPVQFAGQAYYRSGGAFLTHKANFDLNFLPVLDNYESPSASQDQRAASTVRRRQAMFDWWERLFDYTVMRAETSRSLEQPAWLLFHESAELHPDNPAHLVRHLGIDVRHDNLVLRYYLAYQVSSADLEDDRWAVRVWQSEKWIRALLKHFYPMDITQARPDLWASDDPSVPETAFGVTDSGNRNLTQFYRNGCIENGEPRRFEEIKRLNDRLRERGRTALVSYLTHMNRVPMPWGGFAEDAKQLSELLLLDVEAAVCQKASRIEEAVSAIQLFVQRARLGLEPGFPISPDFIVAWERHFATFRTWEVCKRRTIYAENWVEWDELQEARQTEAFRFLESELRRATLTMPVPGGLVQWNGPRPPAHPGITLLQEREPSVMQLLNPAPEGLGLMGTPDRHARPTWLAPINMERTNPEDPDPIEVRSGGLNPSIASVAGHGHERKTRELPMWLQSAVRLGTKFKRIAAAGIPPASTSPELKCSSSKKPSACCSECGNTHPAVMDEYYFWIEDSRLYDKQGQVAEWGATQNDPKTDWHRKEKLPGLLHWKSEPMVHLRWCRVHNGEFQQPRRSYQGVKIVANIVPELVFLGRLGDSLHFEITGGVIPDGFTAPPPAGFRYDLATDEAITLPNMVSSAPITAGGLTAYPFFAWFDPGEPILPPTLFNTAIAMAGHLQAHCQFEAALKWYEAEYNPLLNDNRWIICSPKPPESPEEPDEPGPIEIRSSGRRTVEAAEARSGEGCCCASDPVSLEEAKERAILLHYIETLLQWGDALLRKNTPETFQQARLIFDTAAKILGATPVTVLSHDDPSKAPKVADLEPACAPINPRLMCLYSSVSDRLALIHACMNAKRLKNGRPNVDMLYFGNSGIRECWKHPNEPCVDDEWCTSPSPYRFIVLLQKAQEAAGDVRALGGALMAGYEKGDAEYLAAMRAMHERQSFNLTLEVRQNQWREADWQVQALQKTKEIAQTRLQYYKNLIANGLISGETQYEPLIISSTTTRSAGNIVEVIGQAMDMVPDPYVGFPCNFMGLPPGTKMSMKFSAAARIANTMADILNTSASLGLTKAGWERRAQEWAHQVDVITVEIEQIERQLLAAERRSSMALRELNNHQQQMENSAEVHDFLRDKFTNHELYLWMQQETAAMYYQMYEMALHYARQAQRAFNFEMGYTARQFIPAEMWDNLHEGLLAGERLQLALRHMEKAYYDENVREYELTKHFSMRLHFPKAFLQLQTTGYCEIDIPEWMFDLDYPGHFMRRIKNVTMTIPCVAGPYTGVHCRLTLLSSKTRVDSRLVDPPHKCCLDERCNNGYQAMPDDPRIVSAYAATEAIATSSGQNDSGMFELSFHDERYLPFEFSGAVSRWRIELPPENNYFDMDTLSDMILHLNYTAREGGDLLRKAANKCAQQYLPGSGVRFFDVRHEFPEASQLFAGSMSNDSAVKQLGVRLSRSMFPYLTGNRKVGVHRLELLFKAPGTDPSAHHIVEFLVGQNVGHLMEERCGFDVHSVVCVADAKWPGLFYGVLELNFDDLGMTGYQDLGVFRFPADVGDITDAYLFCWYKRL
ncbi:neuraminidase-like domain-containing protein [Peribacillus simplex]|uniref:Tc toxin subunit A-related protein n=1 Tax=Peribacillus simplex TaxID=1478 RepID=UPI0011A44F55|nr:neuraminidase-like domain-containing protein [Peribacillus simplex]